MLDFSGRRAKHGPRDQDQTVCSGGMVKNPSDERKQLNRGDVLITCFRLCTGLSPGIGDIAENPVRVAGLEPRLSVSIGAGSYFA